MYLDNSHINWLIKLEPIKTNDGSIVEIYDFQYTNNEEILSKWAKHFRNHYCLDERIDILRSGTGKSRSDYLKDLKFPSTEGFGPGTKSGDFTEILIADYLEFLLSYWVPNRWKYSCKDIPNESKKGIDVIGISFNPNNPMNDILVVYEVKSYFSGKENKLQKAVDDSINDNMKKGFTLNAIKQHFIEKDNFQDAKKIERFQNINDNPYKEEFGAATVVDSTLFDVEIIKQTDTSRHPNNKSLSLIVITGSNMRKLITDLYERAANEA